MPSTLFVIDAFLSNIKRANSCENLIKKIRQNYPAYEILLLNKYPKAWSLDEKVDHYYYFGNSFSVGYPPDEVLNNHLYERPYTYIDLGNVIFENWFPLIGVTDHVGDIYNSFLICSYIGKSLGYEKIFKIEYDTNFDDEEFLSISKDIEEFQDYLFFGTRKEGGWAKPHHYLIDHHIVGFSVKCFETYNILKNSEDYWNLCKRIGYWGKWIEYVIPMIVEERKKTANLEGKHFPGNVRNKFPNSSFDTISSDGYWAEHMKYIPKICRISNPEKNLDDVFGLFYYNNFKEGDVESFCQIYEIENRNLIYEKNVILKPKKDWVYDCLNYFNKPLRIIIKVIHKETTYTKEITLLSEDIPKLEPRLFFKN